MQGRGGFPIEIDGQIYHLFLSPDALSPNPSRREVLQNLKHSVLMKDLYLHFSDPDGHGDHLKLGKSRVNPREYINFAGKQGSAMMGRLHFRGKLPLAAYSIVQKDILRGMEKKRERV
jgi:hypothetical protein